MNNVLSLGAGVQSTTVILMSLAGELPPIQHVIFADTGWEPQAVYRHLEELKLEIHKAGIIFHQVSRGDIRSSRGVALLPFFIKNPDGSKGFTPRQCTSNYKIYPIQKQLREIAGLKPRQRCKEVKICLWFGISYDEFHRMKDPDFPWIKHYYPLVDNKITRKDCQMWLKSHGWEDVPRSACVCCPFHSNKEWKNIRKVKEEWDEVVKFDKENRVSPRFRGESYLHPSLKPLDQVDFRDDFERGQTNMFGNECEGLCGV